MFTWLGHANDFGGAGSTSWVEQYDAQLSIAERRMFEDITKVLGDPRAVNAILGGNPTPLIDAVGSDPAWDVTANAASRAGNPLVRFLSAGPSEDAVGVLGKVPYLAYGMTAADMILNRNEGMGKSVVEPLGNLAVGTAITEGTTAALGAAAAGDGAIAALAGTLCVPGVGEVVIVGAAAVLGTYAVDKGAEWVWEHRAEIGHAVSTGRHAPPATGSRTPATRSPAPAARSSTPRAMSSTTSSPGTGECRLRDPRCPSRTTLLDAVAAAATVRREEDAARIPRRQARGRARARAGAAC